VWLQWQRVTFFAVLPQLFLDIPDSIGSVECAAFSAAAGFVEQLLRAELTACSRSDHM
jgi:hypothetical protein